MPWEGKIYRPGARVAREELAGIEGHILAVECVGSEKPGWGHRREPSVYILWHLAPGAEEWAELARASGVGHEWTAVIHAAAIAKIGRGRAGAAASTEAAHRVIVMLEYELDNLGEARDRADLCSRLHDRVLYQLIENASNSAKIPKNALYSGKSLPN